MLKLSYGQQEAESNYFTVAKLMPPNVQNWVLHGPAVREYNYTKLGAAWPLS